MEMQNELFKSEYTIVPKSSYKVMRACGGCQKKSSFINTHHFRVNANGKYLDIWLIYQCEVCKHTYNISLFHRCKAQKFTAEDLQAYMTNDYNLTFKWGLDKSLFHRNQALVDDSSVAYEIRESHDRLDQDMTIVNPYHIKLRIDKVLSEIFKLSRSEIKQLIKSGKLKSKDKYLSTRSSIAVEMNI